MKKGLWILTVLLALALCASALAAPGDATLTAPEGSYIRWLAGEGDTLYYQEDDALYTWKLGDAQPTALAGEISYTGDSYLDALVAGGGKLYGLYQDGSLCEVTVQDNQAVMTPVAQLDWEDMTHDEGDYSYSREITCIRIVDDALYLATSDYSQQDGDLRLSRFDMATGERTDFKTEHISEFTPYQEGQFLVRLYDQSNTWDDETQTEILPTLAVLDLATDTTTEIGPLDDYNENGLEYDAATDTLYSFTRNKIMRRVALGESEVAAYVPAEYMWNARCALLTGGYYAMLDGNFVYVRNTDSAYLPTSTLTISGYVPDDQAHRAFAAAYPDVPVVVSDQYYASLQELGQAMVSGETELDLLLLNTRYGSFFEMMDKGYCEDLSGESEIVSAVSKMYPMFVEAVSKDGKLFAVPVDIDFYANTYRPEVWEEAGLSEEIPATFEELCDLINRWPGEYAQDYPDHQPMEVESNYRQVLFNMVFEMYTDYYLYLGEDLTFDTPLFRKLLALVEDITDEMDPNIDWNAPNAEELMEEIWEKKTLVQTGYGISYLNSRVFDSPLYISLDEGIPCVINSNLMVFVVNPNSKNKEMAVEYIKTYLANMSDQTRIKMNPDQNDPVENKSYQKTLDEMRAAIDTLRASLESAKPEDVAILEEQIASQEQWMQEYADEYRYQISAESIQAYRAAMEHVFIGRPSILSSGGSSSQEFYTLRSRYLEGQMTAEQFIQEASGKLRLMILENR